MKSITLSFSLLIVATLFSACGGLKVNPLPSSRASLVSEIALGSCLREQKVAPIWSTLVDESPDVFLFLGDNIYGDTEDMAEMNEKYDLLFANKDLRKLLKKTEILATWDDHDYGQNDAGSEYPMKEESKTLFMERFYPESDLSQELAGHEGVYHSRIAGPEGQRVQFIMLDTRSFRTSLTKLPESAPKVQGRYMPNYDSQGSILGDDQWAWLEKQLKMDAEIRIISTSIQAIPDNHGWEKWGNLPLERDRLFQLIQNSGATGVILASGDRHLAEISKLPSSDPKGISYPIYEITASSLNQPSGSRIVEPNQFRTSDENYRQENYGLISIDWSQSDPSIQLSIKDMAGEIVLSESLQLSQLQ